MSEFKYQVIKERKNKILDGTIVEKSKDKNCEINDNQDDINIQSKKQRLAFLDLLLEIQREVKDGGLSDQDIREEVDTFMVAGHDTVAASTSFTIFAIGCYPEIQKKVQNELDMIFKDCKTNSEITIDDLSKMKYLDCVIKESLRLYPSLPLISRKLISDLKLADGKIVPSQVTIHVLLYQLHRDPKHFPDPLVFRPERFWCTIDKDMRGNRDRFAYIPFSAGPRNCIGQKFAMMEEKIIIAKILRNFNLKSMLPLQDLHLRLDTIVNSEVGILVQLTSRKLNSVIY